MSARDGRVVGSGVEGRGGGGRVEGELKQGV